MLQPVRAAWESSLRSAHENPEAALKLFVQAMRLRGLSALDAHDHAERVSKRLLKNALAGAPSGTGAAAPAPPRSTQPPAQSAASPPSVSPDLSSADLATLTRGLNRWGLPAEIHARYIEFARLNGVRDALAMAADRADYERLITRAAPLGLTPAYKLLILRLLHRAGFIYACRTVDAWLVSAGHIAPPHPSRPGENP